MASYLNACLCTYWCPTLTLDSWGSVQCAGRSVRGRLSPQKKKKDGFKLGSKEPAEADRALTSGRKSDRPERQSFKAPAHEGCQKLGGSPKAPKHPRTRMRRGEKEAMEQTIGSRQRNQETQNSTATASRTRASRRRSRRRRRGRNGGGSDPFWHCVVAEREHLQREKSPDDAEYWRRVVVWRSNTCSCQSPDPVAT